jgi:hypothetical protein
MGGSFPPEEFIQTGACGAVSLSAGAINGPSLQRHLERSKPAPLRPSFREFKPMERRLILWRSTFVHGLAKSASTGQHGSVEFAFIFDQAAPTI